jgi:hypothetical protein
MAGAGNRSGGFRRTSKGGLSKATGRGREAKAAYKAGRGMMRARARG